MTKGKVYLIGSGPGDLELLTRKAWELIHKADCIIYDHLIDRRALAETKDTCECIYVGKQRGFHTLKQEEINSLLVRKSEQYRCVARLKGGDPYVFGRGGEEALYLTEHGVPFEIVPGISSCIAGPAYAGIPVTHRGISGGFHVVTAHGRDDGLPDIDFAGMAKSQDTCVFLMGLSNLPEIAEKLLAAGKSPLTPSAVISNATLPTQQTVSALLGELAEAIKKRPLPSPAIIVVGETVTLRNQLSFYEKKPLYGKKIFLPLAGNNASSLGKKLYSLGADVRETRTGEISAIPGAVDNIDFSAYTYIVLTSKNAVNFFFQALRKKQYDIRGLSHIHFAVVGEATQKELEQYGVFASIRPETFHSQALWDALAEELKPDDCVLYLCGKLHEPAPLPCPEASGREAGVISDSGSSSAEKEKPTYLEKQLKEHVKTDIVEIYENKPVDPAQWIQVLEKESFDMAVFTCSSSVRNTLPYIKQTQDMKRLRFLSIGGQTSAALKSQGISEPEQSEKATLDSLLALILNQIHSQEPLR